MCADGHRDFPHTPSERGGLQTASYTMPLCLPRGEGTAGQMNKPVPLGSTHVQKGGGTDTAMLEEVPGGLGVNW